MATDLKPYFDAVNSAKANVDQLAAKLDEAMLEGTDEGNLKALELQPQLDGALSKLDEASRLYELRQKADRPNDIAKNYVPVSNTAPDGDGTNSQASELDRKAFDQLSVQDQANFIRSGGTLRDK